MSQDWEHDTTAEVPCPHCGRLNHLAEPAAETEPTPPICAWCHKPLLVSAPQEVAGPADQVVEAGVPMALPVEVLKPWGFWATMGWSVLTAILFLVIEVVLVVVAMVIAAVRDSDFELETYGASLETSGLFLALSFLVAAPACTGLIVLAIRLRRQPVKQYLALNPPPRGAVVKWTLALVLFIACSDAVTHLAGKPIVPEFMRTFYQSAGFLPLFIFTIVVVGPVLEEILYRGFMFAGIASSRLGAAGAIMISAALFALTHVQYDWFGIGMIFLVGLFLGIARARTRSTLVTILLHTLANLVATIEVAIVTRTSGSF